MKVTQKSGWKWEQIQRFQIPKCSLIEENKLSKMTENVEGENAWTEQPQQQEEVVDGVPTITTTVFNQNGDLLVVGDSNGQLTIMKTSLREAVSQTARASPQISPRTNSYRSSATQNGGAGKKVSTYSSKAEPNVSPSLKNPAQESSSSSSTTTSSSTTKSSSTTSSTTQKRSKVNLQYNHLSPRSNTTPITGASRLSYSGPSTGKARRNSLPESLSPMSTPINYKLSLSNYCSKKIFRPECDVLTSVTISPQICAVQWLKYAAHPRLLVANGKHINILQIQPVREKSNRSISLFPENKGNGTPKKEKVPALKIESSGEDKEYQIAVKHRYLESTATPNIHSISVSPDQETFLSANERCVYLWNIQANVNIKIADPVSNLSILEFVDRQKVLTCAKFHPLNSHSFAYGNGGGKLFLADLRESLFPESSAQEFFHTKSTSPDFMQGISDFSFSQDGLSIVTRDALKMNVWDIRNAKEPVKVHLVNDDLKYSLKPIYMSQVVCVGLKCSFAHDDRLLITGNFDDSIFIVDTKTNLTSSIHLKPSSSQDSRLQTLAQKKGAVSRPVICQTYHPRLDVLIAPYEDSVVSFAGTNLAQYY
eukprot:c20819_g2_i1.p1 GENE.c20819_g2_i1~~c20819_g2_i1.p1  ORF type:complete len:595 (-),score=215.27 c20819_g2_i1:436-2220(-)